MMVTNVECVILSFSLSYLKVLKVQSSLLHHGCSNPLQCVYIYIYVYMYIYIYIDIHTYIHTYLMQITAMAKEPQFHPVSPLFSSHFQPRSLGRGEAQPFPLWGVRRRQRSAASGDRGASFRVYGLALLGLCSIMAAAAAFWPRLGFVPWILIGL